MNSAVFLLSYRTEPAFGFGKSTPVEIVDNTPGPGHGHIDSVGRQTLSLHKTAPDVRMHFGDVCALIYAVRVLIVVVHVDGTIR